jgi:hypothetical protein
MWERFGKGRQGSLATKDAGGKGGDPKSQSREPIIKEVGSFTVIGVRHIPFYLNSDAAITRFMTLVNEADHLILEGTQAGHEVGRRGALEDYSLEQVAHKHFNTQGKAKNIHYLENEGNIIAQGRRQGIEPPVSIVTLGFDRIQESVARSLRDPRFSLEADMRKVAMWLRRMQPSIVMETDQIYDHLQRAAGSLRSFEERATAADKRLLKLGNAFALWYSAQVRDAGPISAALEMYMEVLSGKKVIVLGELHVENVVKILNGEKLLPMPSWQSSLAQITPE